MASAAGAAGSACDGSSGRLGAALGASFACSAAAHPLDPLVASEIQATVAAIQKARTAPSVAQGLPPACVGLPVPRTTRWVKVELEEPAKAAITAFTDASQGKPPRVAYVQFVEVYAPSRDAASASRNGCAFHGTVLLSGSGGARVASLERVPRGQPPMTAGEYELSEELVKRDPQFQAALARRGVTNMELVMVDPWCVGWFSKADDASRGRLASPIIWLRETEDDDNGYARALEGIDVVLDLYVGRVLSVQDERMAPMPAPDPLRHWTQKQWKGKYRTDIKPLKIVQPEGPSFTVVGNKVEWQNWHFRVGFTPTEGLVLHNVGIYDPQRDTVRPVAHRLSYAEMVVPYGDPRSPHFRKNAFDAGEDGLGRNAHSLALGCDCKGAIRYFDAHLVGDGGEVETITKAVCLHEEDFGLLWKHVDWRTDATEVRRCRRLVVSFICTIANYEYGFYWYLYQTGSIESEVKLTGVLSTGADPGPWGTKITKDGLYAPIHQHFWVVRIDWAVDGAANSVQEVSVVADREDAAANPYGGGFRAQARTLKSELAAQRDIDPYNGRYWKVINRRSLNRSGAPVSYKLVPGHNSFYKGSHNSSILKRAGFLRHHMWVTKYNAAERYPAGDFPNQNLDEGLPLWTKRDAPLEDQDVVMWYLFGVTHVPQLEDWPVMPVERVSFALHPSGFFDCSAVMDVPPEDGKADGSCEVKGTRLQTLTTPAGGDGTCCASGCSAEVAVVAKAEEEEACKCGDGGSAACKKAACSCTHHRTGAGVTLRSRL